MSETAIWNPSDERIACSQLTAFVELVNSRYDLSIKNYWQLYEWSIDHAALFWQVLGEFVGIKWQKQPSINCQASDDLAFYEKRWFPDGKLNFADNLLSSMNKEQRIISVAEGWQEPVVLERDQLCAQVSGLVHFLKQQGVASGDRVAGVVGNSYHAVVAMLATSAIGAIWTSCSPDFGAEAIVDRFSQVEPKVLFFTLSYQYAGKYIDASTKLDQVLNALPSVRASVVYSLTDNALSPQMSDQWQRFEYHSLVQSSHAEAVSLALTFTEMGFNDPLYILYSSGTTGVPKCIIHGIGGTLIQHKKELMLHSDLQAGDTIFYYTTCGWMMWNWVVSSLSCQANLLLYDGAVHHPTLDRLWQLVERYQVNVFGTSPKFLQLCEKQAMEPGRDFDLTSLKTILSTGAPLLPEQFEWIYSKVAKDVHLASISGGTDIISCFMLGVPSLPVYSGEIQAPGLGMAVDCWNEKAESVRGEKGELVCKLPFPSMPLGFWGDPEHQKFRSAYFEHFPEHQVWRHGDFIEFSEHGGIIVHGRSDATLNPGGVRIGTAEIYRLVESMPEVSDSLVFERQHGSDSCIALVLVLKKGNQLDDAFAQRLKAQIRQALSPRHVPQQLLAVSAIPYTRSGKKLELAVKQAVAGEVVANLAAIANPDSLEEITTAFRVFDQHS